MSMVRSDEHEDTPKEGEPAESTEQPIRSSGFGPASSSLGRLPERFEIRGELGRGGMGVVYRAHDRTAGHEVALKVLHGVSAAARLRLKSEFRALSDIVHPNLIVLHDLVIDDDACFFTMELIRGRDFSEHVRAVWNAEQDEAHRDARIRDLARQLALAIDALHRSEKLHCDVKPSNVLVTESGRVVLVDFGLVYPIASSFSHEAIVEDGSTDAIGGTPSYMAPEQLWGGAPTQASDWFSYGATLHDALSGRSPTRQELARAGGRGSLRERGIAISEELDELLQALLHHDAERRPDAAAILERLGGERTRELAPQSFRISHKTPELVGRDALLESLRSALAPGTAARVVRVFGPSGVGKSTLVQRFVDELQAGPGTVVLRSRCHPQEALAFNALDGLIDDIRRALSHGILGDGPEPLPSAEYDAITRVFPVLASVLTPEASGTIAPSNDRQRRYLAFAAIRELMRRIARRHRLVAWLDDLQWGDHDSGSFLLELFSSQNSPPMLVVLSYRAEDEAKSACLGVLRDDLDVWRATTPLPVGVLDEQQSAALVHRLLGEAWGGDPAVRDALIRSASGSPFLLTQLAHYLSEHPAGTEVAYDEILELRTRAVSPRARAALEVLAVAGAPLEQGALLRAAQLSSDERGLLTTLERLSILRTTDVETRHFEFYHDKLREEVVRRIDTETRARHHATIARALVEGSIPNPLGALEHFDAARDVESVRRYVVAAADHALRLFAFQRAAGLYRRAIELAAGDVPMHELHRRLGAALGSAGHGKEAGSAYLKAAALLERTPHGTASEVVSFRQEAADQFIQAGHFVEGTETLRQVLATYGIKLPRSRNRALAKATALRLKAMLDELLPRRSAPPATEFERQRFDALWVANTRLAWVDYALSSYATARCLVDATRMGEPSRLSRALGMEAAFTSTLPHAFFEKRSVALLSRAEKLAESEGATSYERIFTLSVRATMSFYLGRFREAWQYADRSMEQLGRHRTGRTWEEAPWQGWAFVGLAINGEVRELIRRVQAAADDATLRDDHYLEQLISMGGARLVWLALDRVSEGRRRLEQAIRWVPPTYSVQHYTHYTATVDYALYEGDGLSAWEHTVATWPMHAHEYMRLLRFVRDDLLTARAKSALGAAVALQRSGLSRTRSSYTRRQLLRIAERTAKDIASHAGASATGFSSLLLAGVAHTMRRHQEALRYLRVAAGAFEVAEMRLLREVTRYSTGRVLSGADGRRELATAEAWLRDQGVVRPEKMVDSLAPGFHV